MQSLHIPITTEIQNILHFLKKNYSSLNEIEIIKNLLLEAYSKKKKEEYLEWKKKEIEKGITDAESKKFASAEEVDTVFQKYL